MHQMNAQCKGAIAAQSGFYPYMVTTLIWQLPLYGNYKGAIAAQSGLYTCTGVLVCADREGGGEDGDNVQWFFSVCM